jgi:hypothetical protein
MQAELVQHLADLLVHNVGADEQVVAGEAALGETAVAGEDRPPLGVGERHQLGIVEAGIVGGVEGEGAEPAGEGAQHGVSEQAAAGKRKARRSPGLGIVVWLVAHTGFEPVLPA